MSERERRHARKRVREGDGSALRPFRWWHGFYRTRFTIDRPRPDGQMSTCVVDVDLLDWETSGDCYVDDVQVASAKLPAAFPVPDGEIEVAASTFGLKSMHLVTEDGAVHPLRPVPWTMEHARALFDRRFPTTSRLIGWTAVAILVVGLVVALPAALEFVTHIEVIGDQVGRFTSPISLPGWLSTTLGIAGIVAALERALTLRNHWLIDADTFWLPGG